MTVAGTAETVVEDARRELEHRLERLERKCRELLEK